MSRRFTAVPRIYNSSEPGELGKTNNFLAMVLDPSHAPAVPMPDDTPKVAVLKSTVLYGNLSGQTGYVFLYQPQNKGAALARGRRVTHPAIAGQSVVGWDGLELYDQDLSLSYSRGRPIASCLEVSSTTISSGVFTLNGLMNASSFTGNIQWERMDPDAMTSFDTPTAVFGVSVYDGLHATWIPDTDDLAPIPPASQSLSPLVSGNPVIAFDGGFQYLFRGGFAGTGAVSGFVAPGTVLAASDVIWESHPAAAWNPSVAPALVPTDLPGRIKIRASVVLTIPDADYAANLMPVPTLQAQYINGAGAYVQAAAVSSGFCSLNVGPKVAGRTAVRWTTEMDVDANIPIDRWSVILTSLGGCANVQFGSTADARALCQVNVDAPDSLSDHQQNHRIVMSISNVDANANITFKGLTNWEVVPNFTLAQEINPDYRVMDTPDDLYAAMALLGSNQFRPIKTIADFNQENRHYSNIVIRDNLRVMNASFFSGLGKALKGGFNWVTQKALPAALSIADHPLTRLAEKTFNSSESKTRGKEVWNCSSDSKNTGPPLRGIRITPGMVKLPRPQPAGPKRPKLYRASEPVDTYRCGSAQQCIKLATTYCGGCDSWVEQAGRLVRSVCDTCSGKVAKQLFLYEKGAAKFERQKFRVFDQFRRLVFKTPHGKQPGCVATYSGKEVIALHRATNLPLVDQGLFKVSTDEDGNMLLSKVHHVPLAEVAHMRPMPRFTLAKYDGDLVAAILEPPEASTIDLFPETKLERQTNGLTLEELGSHALEPPSASDVEYKCSSVDDDDNPFADDVDIDDEDDDEPFEAEAKTQKMPVSTAKEQAKNFAKGSTVSEWLAGSLRPTVVRAQIFPIVSQAGNVKFCTVYATSQPIVGEKYYTDESTPGISVNLDRFLPSEHASVMQVCFMTASSGNIPMVNNRVYVTFVPPRGVLLNQGSYGLALAALLIGLPNIAVLSGVLDVEKSQALAIICFTAPGDMALKADAAAAVGQNIIFGATGPESEYQVESFNAYFSNILPPGPGAYEVTTLSDMIVMCLARGRRKGTSAPKYALPEKADRKTILAQLKDMATELKMRDKKIDHIEGLLGKAKSLSPADLRAKASKILDAYAPKTKNPAKEAVTTTLTPEQLRIVQAVAAVDTDDRKASDVGEIEKAQRIVGAWKGKVIGKDAEQTAVYVNHLKAKYLGTSKKAEKKKKSARTIDDFEDDDDIFS